MLDGEIYYPSDKLWEFSAGSYKPCDFCDNDIAGNITISDGKTTITICPKCIIAAIKKVMG